MNHQIILHRLGISDYKQTGDEYLTNCIFCGETKYNFQINMRKNLWHCWVCNAGGSLPALLSQLLDIPIVRVRELFQLEDIIVDDRELEIIINEFQEIEPVRFNYRIYTKNKKRYAQWRKRGINKNIVRQYDLGYDERRGRIIIPVFDDKERCVALIRRTVRNEDPKYLYTKGFNKKEMVYPMRGVDYDNDTIVLTEGAIDAIKMRQLGFNSIAMMGLNLSKFQVKFIRHWEHVILALDNDDAAYDNMYNIIAVLYEYCNVYHMEYSAEDPAQIEDLSEITALKQVFAI